MVFKSRNKIDPLILCIFIISFIGVSKSQMYVGERCTANTFSGVCLKLKDCPVVEQELLSGKPPQKTCGFASADEPIICCPPGGTIRPARQNSTTTMPIIDSRPISNRLAERMCTEYSKAVYQNGQSVCALDTEKLIVGGITADPQEFPHMAVLGFDGGSAGIKWLCGATLVSEIFVLTAAHCTWNINWGDPKKVRVGDLNLKSTNEFARPQERYIAQTIVHPYYRQPSDYHDLALLKMDSPVTFDGFVRPACLSTTPVVPATVTATGWGLTDWSDDEGSETLLKVVLSVITPDTCNQYYRNDKTSLSNGVQPNIQICAGNIGKDTCQGDSGGPLSIYNSNHYCMYTVVGVTSVGRLCGNNIPGLYTRVYPYLDWLESIIWS